MTISRHLGYDNIDIFLVNDLVTSQIHGQAIAEILALGECRIGGISHAVVVNIAAEPCAVNVQQEIQVVRVDLAIPVEIAVFIVTAESDEKQIDVMLVDTVPLGVDTPHDLERARQILAR